MPMAAALWPALPLCSGTQGRGGRVRVVIRLLPVPLPCHGSWVPEVGRRCLESGTVLLQQASSCCCLLGSGHMTGCPLSLAKLLGAGLECPAPIVHGVM